MHRKRNYHGISYTKTMFLDTLPEDCLSSIVRHTSRERSRDNWQDFIDTEHLHHILKSGRRMESVTRQIIGRLNQPEFDSTKLSRERLEDFAPNLRSIRYSYTAGEIPRCMLQSPNLHALYLNTHRYQRFPFDGVLAACGASLDVLWMDLNSYVGSPEVVPITRYCLQLKELYIDAFIFNESELKPLWPVVGKTITKLTLKASVVAFEDGIETLEPIARNCVKLENIHLNHPRHVWLYKQLGSQLKVIRIESNAQIPAPPEIRDILYSCPNTCIHPEVGVLDVTQDKLEALSSRLSSITADIMSYNPFPNLPALREAHLTIRDHQIDNFKSFFAFPRPSLRILGLYSVSSGEIFGEIEKSVTCLQELYVSLRDVSVQTALLATDRNSLLPANSSLQRLDCTLLYPDHDFVAYRFLVTLLRQVQIYKELSIIKLSKYNVEHMFTNPIRDVCVPLRNRRMSVSYNGIRFLPN